MNHLFKGIGIWHGTSLGLGIQICSNEVHGVTNGHALRGHSFI